MELISKEYNSEDEKNTFNEKQDVRIYEKAMPKKQVVLAPVMNDIEIKNDQKYYDSSVLKIYDNPKCDVLYAPIKGPQVPNRHFYKNTGNAIHGNVEHYKMDDFSFDDQFLTFKNYGYANDPSGSASATMVGDKNKFEEFGGSTVFCENPLKRKKYKRPEREKTGKPSDVDEYKGPWAKFLEDEDIIEEINLKQKRMKEMYEKKQTESGTNKNGTEESKELKPKKSDVTTTGEDAVIEEETAEKVLEDCPPESTIFEYVQEFDYQGRTYMHCDHEFRNNDPEHRCYIPTKHVHTWRGHTSSVNAIRWFPETGHVLLSASMDKTLKLWDVNTHRRLLRTMTGHSKGVRDITFSKDGTKFLSVGHDQWIKQWDTETGKAISRSTSGVNSLCAKYYPMNENEFLAGQSDKLVVGWDIRSNSVIQKYDDHLRAVNAITFIDQNRKFVSSSDDKKILIWEYGIPVVVNHISEPYMNSVPFLTESPDKNWFMGQSMDNSVVCFNANEAIKFMRKRRYIGHNSFGYACQVDASPDMQFIVSGDSEGRAFFWDWKTKKIYKRLKAHDKVTIGAIWHPVHPSKVATCSWDKTIKFWD